jgi:hypothetical protein
MLAPEKDEEHFVGLADPPLWLADILGAGSLGGDCEPVRGAPMAGRLSLARGVNVTWVVWERMARLLAMSPWGPLARYGAWDPRCGAGGSQTARSLPGLPWPWRAREGAQRGCWGPSRVELPLEPQAGPGRVPVRLPTNE